MKRITLFSIVLSIILSLCVNIPIINASVEYDKSLHYIEIIKEFDFMDSGSSEDFFEDETIDREDAVKYILNLMNISNYSDNHVQRFIDISIYYDNFEIINTGVVHGLIKGDTNGKFRPKDQTTYNEAIIMIMRALGYEIIAQGRGGHIWDYYNLAKQYGLLNNLNIQGEQIKRSEFAKMLYNSFDVPIVEQSKFGNEAGYNINNQKTALSFFKIKRGSGVLIANDLTSIYYSTKETVQGRVKISDNEFYVGNTNASEYLGYNVEYYYFDDEDANIKELRYIAKKDNEINSLDLSKYKYEYKDENLIYYDDNNNEIKININPSICMIFNGKSIEFNMDLITEERNTGTFKLINNKKSGNDYDIIFIDIYVNDIVSSVNETDGYIYLKYSAINGNPYIELPLDRKNKKIIVFKDNSRANISDIKQGDTISYSIGGDGNIVTIQISTKIVQGLIEEIVNDDKSYIVLNGENYLIASDFYAENNKVLSESVLLYLNYQNHVVDIMLEISKKYAYVLKVNKSKGVESKGMVKLFTYNGVVEEFNLAEKVAINGERTFSDSLGTHEYTHDLILAKLNDETDNLISYELDGNNEINNIIFSKLPSGNEYEDQDKFILSHKVTEWSISSGVTIDGIGIRNMILFNIPEMEDGDIEEKECSAVVKGLVRSRNYKNLLLYDVGYDGNAKVGLLREKDGTSYRVTPNKTYIFNKAVDIINNEGLSAKRIYYFTGGFEGSIILNEDAINVPLTNSPANNKLITEYEFGDVFTFETNLSGEISKYSIIYKDNVQQDFMGILYSGGEGVGNNRELLMIQGTLRYKDNEILTIQYPLNNKKAYEIMTVSNDFQVSLLNKERGTIKFVSLDSLYATNFASATEGQKILINANRNDLKEVIVYE